MEGLIARLIITLVLIVMGVLSLIFIPPVSPVMAAVIYLMMINRGDEVRK